MGETMTSDLKVELRIYYEYLIGHFKIHLVGLETF